MSRTEDSAASGIFNSRLSDVIFNLPLALLVLIRLAVKLSLQGKRLAATHTWHGWQLTPTVLRFLSKVKYLVKVSGMVCSFSLGAAFIGMSRSGLLSLATLHHWVN